VTLKFVGPQANTDEDGFQGLSLPKTGADDLVKAEAETQVDCSPPSLLSDPPRTDWSAALSTAVW